MASSDSCKPASIAIIGGAGHVGLPLALVFADQGLDVIVYDINEKVLDTVKQGIVPFMEEGAEPLLKQALAQGKLTLTADPEKLKNVPVIIMTIGTPVDEFLNPEIKLIRECLDDLLPYFRDGQLLVLRSTVYPGTTAWLDGYLKAAGKNLKVAFCPERIMQGRAIEEVQRLPQLVSGTTGEAEEEASRLFALIAPQVVRLAPMEAEFAKLMTNAYRYLQFAIANEFYMIVNGAGLDYNRIHAAMTENYPRAKHLPKAGFAAGPCLFKDTMQLAAFFNNRFSMGHAAMLVNEGLVLYLVDEIEKSHDLSNLSVGLLGMSFKADSDDIRSSLSYKLKKALEFRSRTVYTTDPHVTQDPHLLPLEIVIAKSDILILCVPHSAYRNLDPRDKPLIDIWGHVTKQSVVLKA